MPATHDPKLPLRLAFSHREKAEAAIRQCDRSLQEGGVDAEHHAKLREVYERELRTAQRTVQRLLGVEQARMESLEAQRRAALEEQLHLPERVAAGKIAARAANDANRRLTQRLADIDNQIAVCRSRLESRTSEELGGFMDLSFPEYGSEESRPHGAGLPGTAESAARTRDWYYTTVFSIAAAVAVFLPWFGKHGVTSSLATADGGLAQLAVLAGLPEGLARFAWLLLAVVPFLGIAISAGRNTRVYGAGLLLLGLAMLAGAAFPALALGARGEGPATLMQLLASFRLGALVYCAGALGFIVLGAYRVSPPGDSLRHATAVSLALLGSVGGIGVLAALALLGAQGLPRVAFSAALDERTKDRIAFSIANDGRDPIVCYFPLPEGDTASPAPALRTFGLQLDVREKGRDTYSTVPPGSRVWDLAQGPLPDDRAMTINAGSALKGRVDLRQLSALGVEPAFVRLRLLSRGGSVAGETEVALDGRYLSAPGPIRDPLVIAPPPARPAAAAPATAAGTAPENKAVQAIPSMRVEFIGAVGGRAIIHVFSPDGSSFSEAIAGPGEPVAGGWTVESLERQPSSVNMTHAPSGASVRVIRGNVVEIRAVPSS